MLDPLSDDMWNTISSRVKKNTEIYREIFGVYPDDTVKKVSSVRELQNQAKPGKYHERKNQILGFGVEFPLEFLSEENLRKLNHFGFGLYLVPDHIFT